MTVIIKNFGEWLYTKEGGSLTKEPGEEHCRKLRRSMKYGVSQIKDFCSRKKLNELFTEMPKIRKFQPGTTASYLTTVKLFAKYLFLEKLITSREKEVAITTCGMILSTVNKERKVREAEVEAKAEEEMITGEEIKVRIVYILKSINKCYSGQPTTDRNHSQCDFFSRRRIPQ